MEVIQWTSLWNKYKGEFEKEKTMIGGSLGDKAGEDLKLRIIEHVKTLNLSYLFVCIVLKSSLILHIFFCRISSLSQGITQGLP